MKEELGPRRRRRGSRGRSPSRGPLRAGPDRPSPGPLLSGRPGPEPRPRPSTQTTASGARPRRAKSGSSRPRRPARPALAPVTLGRLRAAPTEGPPTWRRSLGSPWGLQPPRARGSIHRDFTFSSLDPLACVHPTGVFNHPPHNSSRTPLSRRPDLFREGDETVNTVNPTLPATDPGGFRERDSLPTIMSGCEPDVGVPGDVSPPGPNPPPRGGWGQQQTYRQKDSGLEWTSVRHP